MMQLIVTVLAIGLAALLAAGGINYFSTDIGVKVEVSQALKAQHDAIAGAISSYRMANNGFVSSDLDRLKGFLPDGKIPAFPHGEEVFKWSIEKDAATGQVIGLCLTRSASTVSKGAAEGLIAFAKDRQRLSPDDGAVLYGVDCSNAETGTAIGETGQPLDYGAILNPPGAAIFFKGV